MVSPSKTGAGSLTSSHPRLAKTFCEMSVTLWPVTSAKVKVVSSTPADRVGASYDGTSPNAATITDAMLYSILSWGGLAK